MDKIKLIIDTDIGGDIDDALCLCMALNSPEVDLLGVTTVYAGNQWRTDLARRMLKAYEREGIPVRRGAERPLIGRFPHDKGMEPLENEAVPFLIETCRNNPGCILLGIGPMTNISLALSIAPDIARHTRFVQMGGMVRLAQPEWNIQCDPEAARIVFEKVPLSLVGLDITQQCSLTKEQSMMLADRGSPAGDFLKGELNRFFSQFDFLPILHDPLALASLLWDDLITWEMLDIRVETGSGLTRGATVHTRNSQGGKIRYAVSVQAEEAVRRMMDRIRGIA